MNFKAISVAVTLLVAACATPTINVSVEYDEKHASSLMLPGANAVKGSGFIRQQGGGVVTCAGQNVYLVPATNYAKARMRSLYGNDTKGFRSALFSLKIEGEPPNYTKLVHTTRCDAQGNFLFEGIADGEFYATTAVLWVVGYAQQGGNVMQRVELSNGRGATVILSP